MHASSYAPQTNCLCMGCCCQATLDYTWHAIIQGVHESELMYSILKYRSCAPVVPQAQIKLE